MHLPIILKQENNAQGASDREKQFKNDFFEMHHGRRGADSYVDSFALCNPSEFELYCVRRMEAAFSRKAAATAARRGRKCVREAASAAAKALRDVRLVARAASLAAVALAAKVEKKTRGSAVALVARRSQAAHEALQQERRNRKKAGRIATSARKQARKNAAMFVGRVIEAAVNRVAARGVSAGEVPVRFSFESLSSIPRRRLCSLKSKTMPRRKRSARKSGNSITTEQQTYGTF